MLPCHSCYIYETGRSKEVVRINVIVWRNLKGGSYEVKKGTLFMEELIPQVFYQNYLPISPSFNLKRVL